MRYWQGGFVSDVLYIVCLIAIASALRRGIGPMRKLGIPDALVAGAIGLVLGPSVLGVLDFDPNHLEALVYHGLALIFITVSLQSAPKSERAGSAKSIAFAIPITIAMQAVFGLVLVLAWNLISAPATPGDGLHPGVGLMLPLGFSQGPGVALSLGSGWEGKGMKDGAQIGLIFAAMGFAWCTLGGVMLVSIARKRGWVDPKETGADLAMSDADSDIDKDPLPVGALEPLTGQVVAVGVVYFAVFALLSVLTPIVPEAHRPTLWAFHFIFGTGLAIAARAFANRVYEPRKNPLDDRLLARLSSLVVDLTTACALAAVDFGVVQEWLGPILVFTLSCGIVTSLWVVWISRRAFPVLSFHHGIITYGAMTGTATTGMALLRMIDPELRTQAARNYVLGSAGASLLSLPMLGIIPYAVKDWPESYPTRVNTLIAMLVGYALVLTIIWFRKTPARLLRPLTSFWPADPPA